MTTLTSPHDLLAAIPFLIGYHPEDSLVVVSIKDNAVGMAMRIDYPVDIPEGAYDLLASHLQRDLATGALLVAYVPSDRSDGEVVLSDASAALTRIGISTDESLLISLTVILSRYAVLSASPDVITAIPCVALAPIASKLCTYIFESRYVLDISPVF